MKIFNVSFFLAILLIVISPIAYRLYFRVVLFPENSILAFCSSSNVHHRHVGLGTLSLRCWPFYKMLLLPVQSEDQQHAHLPGAWQILSLRPHPGLLNQSAHWECVWRRDKHVKRQSGETMRKRPRMSKHCWHRGLTSNLHDFQKSIHPSVVFYYGSPSKLV